MRTSAWDDSWVQTNLKLRDLVVSVPPMLSRLKVCDHTDEGGEWCLEAVSALLHVIIVHQIQALLHPSFDGGEDTLLWPESSMEGFSISTTYSLLQDHDVAEANGIWKIIWRLHVPNQVRSFI